MHGPDIYNFMLANVVQRYGSFPQELTLTMNQMATRDCRFIDNQDSVEKEEEVVAKIRVKYNDNLKTYSLVETSDEITDYIDYDEENMVGNAVIEESSIIFKNNSPYSLMEIVVALNKKLLTYSLEKYKNCKWIFVRVDIFSDVENASDFYLSIASVSNKGLVKSEIIVNEVRIGHIYFYAQMNKEKR